MDEELKSIILKAKPKKKRTKCFREYKFKMQAKPKMDLLRTVQENTLERVRNLPMSKKISTSSDWVDYDILKSALKSKEKDLARFLLRNGCRVNKMPDDKNFKDTTPLHHAVTLGDIDLLCRLLEQNASVAVGNQHGNTPLHLAFLARNHKMVEILLPFSKGTTKVNPANKCGLSHLHIACASNCPVVVLNFLAAGVNVDTAVSFKASVWAGFTPLHFAVEFQCTEVVTILLHAKANRFAKNAAGLTPSELAKQFFNKAAMIDYFLSDNQGDEINGNRSVQPSNFHLACLRDEPEVVKSFIDNGASLDEKVSDSSTICPLYTPLHFAVESKNPEKVRLLLERGAPPDSQTGHYMSSLHLAMYNDEPDSSNGIVNLLYSSLENKDADRPDLNGLTHLHIACSRNDVKLIERLLDRGEDVNGQLLYNLRGFVHFTPLHFAVRYRSRESVELLLKRGAHVNRSDNGMYGTPLHLAVEIAAEPEILELLLTYGARPGAQRPIDDKTALHLLIGLIRETNCPPGGRRQRIERLSCRAPAYVERFFRLGCDVNERDTEGSTALHTAASSPAIESELVKALLEWGADINVENDAGATAFMLAVPKHRPVLYEHVQCLRAARMRLSRKNEMRCVALRRAMSDTQLQEATRRWQQYEDEVYKMRSMMLDSNVSLLMLLESEGWKRYYDWGRCSNALRRLLESRSFDKMFPCYGYLIKHLRRRILKIIGEQEIENLGAHQKKRKLSIDGQ